MARIGGLKALFGVNQIKQVLSDYVDSADSQVLESLKFLGEEFVNKARLTNTYLDDTGNLRSSIGYIILLNGDVKFSGFKKQAGSGDGDLGKLEGLTFAYEVAQQYQEGFVLIGVAGMKYAAYLEAKNFDVITGSAPTAEEIKSLYNEINT